MWVGRSMGAHFIISFIYLKDFIIKNCKKLSRTDRFNVRKFRKILIYSANIFIFIMCIVLLDTKKCLMPKSYFPKKKHKF